MSVLIRQTRIVDPRSEFNGKVVDVLFDGGKISAIGEHLSAEGAKITEGEGLHLSPGWVDVFADYREPGYEHKETIATGLKAAEAGGFTDVLLAPNTAPAISSKSTIQYILQKAAGAPVRIHPLGSITQDLEGKTLAEMLDMHAHGALAFTDGWKPVQNANLMLKALEYVKSFDGVLIQIPVDSALAAGGLMHEGEISTRLGMAGIPVLAETIQLHRDLELVRYTGSRMHITGLSTAEGVEMIRRAKQEGLQVTCSVTPYHLALSEEALVHYDSGFKVTPVLRSEADRQALIAGLADGTIDCIASHHRPQEWDAKAKEFEYAADGMNIQEISFPVLLDAVEGKVTVERLADALAIRPRSIFGLEQAIIQKDASPSVTLFSLSETTAVNERDLVSLSRNNPFTGRKLRGKVHAILNNKNNYND